MLDTLTYVTCKKQSTVYELSTVLSYEQYTQTTDEKSLTKRQLNFPSHWQLKSFPVVRRFKAMTAASLTSSEPSTVIFTKGGMPPTNPFQTYICLANTGFV